MSVLDCTIPRAEWAHEVPERNGVVRLRSKDKANKADAGLWEPAVKKIVRFQHLGDDWDGAGATAPSFDVLASAIGLAYVLCEKGVEPPHRVVPGLGARSFLNGSSLMGPMPILRLLAHFLLK